MRVLLLIIIFTCSFGFNKSFYKETDNSYLDQTILEASIKHNVPKKLIKAILKHESNLTLNSINKKTKDYGIAQINIRNIKSYKLNKNKLLTNLKYSVDKGVFIMAYFKNRYENELGDKWIAKYNCGTREGCENWKSSKIYMAKISNNMRDL
jgi:hypothetical protein